MSPDLLLYILIAILTLGYALEQVSEYLNLKHQPPTPPEELADLYEQETYQKALDYHAARTQHQFWSSSLNTLLWIVMLSSGFLGYVYRTLDAAIASPWMVALAVFGSLFLLLDLINLPLQLQRTFGIEERFGFNKTTMRTFVTDKFKGYLLSALIGGGLLSVLLWTISGLGPNFWWVFSLIAFVFIVFVNFFYTSLIVPLFNKLSPIEDGALKSAIEGYAQKEGFELSKTFVMDGSRRSSKANAFFSGLGRQKKVVLFDTLVDKFSISEVIAVLAHEVGHYKRGHIPKNLFLSTLNISVSLFLLSLFVFSPLLSQAMGAHELAIPLNLIAFGFLYSPISTLVGIGFNMLSRKYEFEADAFAARTADPEAMVSALKNLSVANLATLEPHPLYVLLNYSHPPVIERIRAIRKLSA